MAKTETMNTSKAAAGNSRNPLDILSFILSLIGLVSIPTLILQTVSYGFFPLLQQIHNYTFLTSYAGLLLAIIALATGSQRKWQPIVAIVLSLFTFLVSVVTAILVML